jgi:hypothetical protein
MRPWAGSRQWASQGCEVDNANSWNLDRWFFDNIPAGRNVGGLAASGACIGHQSHLPGHRSRSRGRWRAGWAGLVFCAMCKERASDKEKNRQDVVQVRSRRQAAMRGGNDPGRVGELHQSPWLPQVGERSAQDVSRTQQALSN